MQENFIRIWKFFRYKDRNVILFCSRSTLSKGKKEVSCWSDWQNDDRHLGGARGLGPHATTRDCRWVRIRRGKLEFETFWTFTHQSFSWYVLFSLFVIFIFVNKNEMFLFDKWFPVFVLWSIFIHEFLKNERYGRWIAALFRKFVYIYVTCWMQFVNGHKRHTLYTNKF